MVNHNTVWQYAHGLSVLSAVLLFTAGFLCVLLWTNNIVQTSASLSSATTNTFTYYSPAVQTFKITYGVAIFGTAWNSILFVTLVILGRDTLPISTERFRYELEKAACIVAISGNAIYSVACIALMATLARLAANPPTSSGVDKQTMMELAASEVDRQAGQGSTAAMAGLAAATAIWACVMDGLHWQKSSHRRSIKSPLLNGGGVAEDKEA